MRLGNPELNNLSGLFIEGYPPPASLVYLMYNPNLQNNDLVVLKSLQIYLANRNILSQNMLED